MGDSCDSEARRDRALKSADVIELVKAAVAQHGAPEYIRSDNGSEFIAKELQRWLAENKIEDHLHRARAADVIPPIRAA